jgi:hypothetical protein
MNGLCFFNQVGDKVMTYTTKMEETDAWFEDKTNMVQPFSFFYKLTSVVL